MRIIVQQIHYGVGYEVRRPARPEIEITAPSFDDAVRLAIEKWRTDASQDADWTIVSRQNGCAVIDVHLAHQ